MQEDRVPFHRASLGQAEIDEVVDTLRSGWLTSGPKTARFEAQFGEFVAAPYRLGVNSCTAALHLALTALGLREGDEVITTPLTFCATVNSILHTGATAVLADVGEDGNLDPRSVAEAVNGRTRAILPVHFAGSPCEMKDLWSLAAEHRLAVVEDAAHAVGAHYQDNPIGGEHRQTGYRSDAVAYSFYATKNLTTGEGGMLTTHDQALAEKARSLCLHGISRDAWNRYSDQGNWYYEVTGIGFKYNLSDILASIGIHQLRRQVEFIARRKQIADRYSEAFAQMEELIPPRERADTRHAWHLYVLRLNAPFRARRDELIRRLHEAGVQCSVHFIPVTLHPAYDRHPRVVRASVDRAEQFYRASLSLPLYPAMTDADVDFVIRAVRDAVARLRVRAFAAQASG